MFNSWHTQREPDTKKLRQFFNLTLNRESHYVRFGLSCGTLFKAFGVV
ncbi:hypothetical protein KOR42_23150 [Thalassoglobus neptunius]|uniref:Uncharacterized protein n=1 Tax=Thalassoglobus neptunius TaxID=1938619 RepID=A0A5C5X7Y5_9PLAN|nr:hypothetical protein KOR42_23150 [Thalassoglobus neptunius]